MMILSRLIGLTASSYRNTSERIIDHWNWNL
jgi:hypothetical protein